MFVFKEKLKHKAVRLPARQLQPENPAERAAKAKYDKPWKIIYYFLMTCVFTTITFLWST